MRPLARRIVYLLMNSPMGEEPRACDRTVSRCREPKARHFVFIIPFLFHEITSPTLREAVLNRTLFSSRQAARGALNKAAALYTIVPLCIVHPGQAAVILICISHLVTSECLQWFTQPIAKYLFCFRILGGVDTHAVQGAHTCIQDVVSVHCSRTYAADGAA